MVASISNHSIGKTNPAGSKCKTVITGLKLANKYSVLCIQQEKKDKI
jgi:hypothetical protein